MLCPKCASAMDRVEYAEVTVDRCTHCRGLWFDAGEREKLMALDGSERLDIGTESARARWDPVDTIDCPRCEVRMLRLVDARTPSVHFEQCAECGGSFLDAGEFRALKPKTLRALLRGLLG